MTPEEFAALPVQAKVDIWMQRHAAGEMTIEDYREVVKVMRAERFSAADGARASKASKSSAPKPDAGALLAKLKASFGTSPVIPATEEPTGE